MHVSVWRYKDLNYHVSFHNITMPYVTLIYEFNSLDPDQLPAIEDYVTQSAFVN